MKAGSQHSPAFKPRVPCLSCQCPSLLSYNEDCNWWTFMAQDVIYYAPDVKCMFNRKLNLLSPLILAISFAGRTRTLSPSWMCPNSIRPATLNPDPWAEEGRRRARRHLVIWSFHGCNSYYEAHINNMHTHTKWKPLKMSAMQHLNGFSMGRIGGTNWSVDIKKT